jgi:Tfp pilus assembly protein PilO
MRTLQSQILWCTRAQRVLVAFMLLTLVTFYFCGYRPATARLSALRAQIATRAGELASNQSKSSIKTEIAAYNERLKFELDRIRKPSRQHELPQLIKDLTFFAQEANLKKFNFKSGMPGRSDLFLEQPVALAFDGDFVSVFNFLRSAESMQRLTRMRSMTLKVKDDRSGNVQALVSMNMYFSTE